MENNNQNQNDGNKKYFWIALICFALGLVALGLSFTVLGVYALFSSMILELASVSFLNAQKRIYYFDLCKVLRVASYVVMLIGVAMVLGVIGFKATE